MTGPGSTRPGPGALLRKGLQDLRRPSFPVDAPPLDRPPTTGPPDRYPLDLRPMTAAVVLDDEGLVVTRAATGEIYRNPVSVSLYALARHTEARSAGWRPEAGAAERTPDVRALLAQARWLRAAQDDNGGWRYPVPVPRYQVLPGWYSAMAQGLAVSVMLRGYAVTGERSYLDACQGATELMLRPLAAGGCSHYDGLGRPFLEECPSEPAGHILNGAVFALFGLLELGRVAGPVEQAAPAADRLRGALPGFDLGYWTRYDLRHRAPSSLAYHCLHVSLLTATGRLLADRRWLATAAAWDRYTHGPVRQLRAAACKGRFVIGERRARG